MSRGIVVTQYQPDGMRRLAERRATEYPEVAARIDLLTARLLGDVTCAVPATAAVRVIVAEVSEMIQAEPVDARGGPLTADVLWCAR